MDDVIYLSKRSRRFMPCRRRGSDQAVSHEFLNGKRKNMAYFGVIAEDDGKTPIYTQNAVSYESNLIEKLCFLRNVLTWDNFDFHVFHTGGLLLDTG